MNFYDNPGNSYYLFISYLIIINIYGIVIMGIDKWKAERRRYRVPEKTLFAAAILGGAAGIYAGMKLFHHKTLHNKFRYGIPVILAANIFVIYCIFNCI